MQSKTQRHSSLPLSQALLSEAHMGMLYFCLIYEVGVLDCIPHTQVFLYHLTTLSININFKLYR